MPCYEGVALGRMERAEHVGQFCGAEALVLTYSGDGQRESALQALELLVDRSAIAGPGLFRDFGDMLRSIGDRRIEIDDGAQAGGRCGEIHVPGRTVTNEVAATELVPFEALPHQFVVLRVERHENRFRWPAQFGVTEQVFLH